MDTQGQAMNDLEITKRCAEAMGIALMGKHPADNDRPYTAMAGYTYDPLHDDAQAMALGKAHPEVFEEAVIMWRRMGMKDSLNLILCQMIASTR